MSDDRGGYPAGDVYDWYVRGLSLLDSGNPDAAAHLLERAHLDEPRSVSIREALGRAVFDAGHYTRAAEVFRSIIADNPDDDYARFGLGLSLNRLGEHSAAVEHLALAVAMRPQRADYVQALRQTRATLRARGELA
ncbi:MAG: tetratricopeptide repeat protein [Actinomycetota bacterium]|nr:tetratricopeptide repeat protein [Actinomycetota bacterium]